MLPRAVHARPLPWRENPGSQSHGLLRPFRWMNWCFAWAAWALGNWALLEVLEYLGAFSVLIAVVFYFAESGDRIKQKHYQAWQVINTAQGKGGSGGRIEALQELNRDRVPLVGVDASEAFLQGVRLARAQMSRCDLHAADLRDSDLSRAVLTYCSLRSANFRMAILNDAVLSDADLSNADLSGADLHGANLVRTNLEDADLRGAELNGIVWRGIGSLRLANVFGVRHAPDGFVDYALAHGAVALASDADWQKLQEGSTKQ